jgi:phosphatidylglycerophosphate synthase
MQAVIALADAVTSSGKRAEVLMQPVSGIPLLMRTVRTASRAGADQVVLICPEGLADGLVQQFVQEMQKKYGLEIKALHVSEFDAATSSSWIELKRHLNDRFLWLPWNWITTKQFLTNLPLLDMHSVDWAKPAYVALHEVNRDKTSSSLLRSEGIAVTSPESIASAERFLVAHSGKALDGIHTSFNRRLCRPFVRWLSHTSVTPNAVTIGGVLVSIVSALAFAHGSYWYSVLGAFLFYIAGLFDEMDGMLARVKFAESPWGTWLESLADGVSYILLFGGITIGLHRRYGRIAIWMGIALLIGTVLALVTTSLQRRLATRAGRPNEYRGRIYQLLEKDSGNWISRSARQLEAFIRRGVMIHYVFLFTLIGALPLLFSLAVLGSHLTWILTLYFNRRFFTQSARSGAEPKVSTCKEAL